MKPTKNKQLTVRLTADEKKTIKQKGIKNVSELVRFFLLNHPEKHMEKMVFYADGYELKNYSTIRK
jgi:hypothetical protein